MPKTLFVPADTGDLHLLTALRDRVRTGDTCTEHSSFLTATVANGTARAHRDRRIAARAAAAALTNSAPASEPRTIRPDRPLLVPSHRLPSRPTPVHPGLLPVFRAA